MDLDAEEEPVEEPSVEEAPIVRNFGAAFGE